MKTKDIPDELVELIIGDQLEIGWEYISWGKKITLEKTDDVMNHSLADIIAKELKADKDNYDIPVKLTRKELQWPCKPPVDYYACIYMDKHDGDSCGVIVLHENKVREKINNHIKEIKKLLDV